MPIAPTNKRHIVFLARSWNGRGGMQRYNRDLAQHLAASRSGDCTVIYPASGSMPALLSFALRSLRASLGKRGNVQVHLSDLSLLPLGICLKILTRGRLSATACGLDVVYDSAWYQWMLHLLLPRADSIVCISHATAQEVLERGCRANVVNVIPCGTTIRPVGPQPAGREKIILSVGRLVRRKGIAWFVSDVFPALSRETDARLIIVGRGADLSAIRRAVAHHALGDRVEIQTELTDAERDALFARADLFVMPNIAVAHDMEGFGIVCIEAAMRGIPVAAAKIEGLKDAVLDGGTGRFFQAGNAQDCLRVVGSMLKNPPGRQAVHDAACKTFAWDVVFPQYLSHVF